MRLLIPSIFIVLMLMNGCAVKNQNNSDKIQIVTTISPLRDFTDAVGGEHVDVYQLLPTGADPHSWEPRPSDLQKIQDTDVFVYVGAGLEPWIETISGIEDKVLIESGKYVTLAESHVHEDHEHEEDEDEIEIDIGNEHGAFDPHIWLDFENDKEIVDVIAEQLSILKPEYEEYFLQNAASYNDKLDELDSMYSRSLKDCRHDKFIVGGHSAFGYLAERYGLEQVAISGLSPDAEPSAKKLSETIDILENSGIDYVIFEKITNPKVAEIIAKETGAETVELDPGVSSDRSFLEVMEENLDKLIIVLGCS